MEYKNLTSLVNQVEYCLDKYPHARNSDWYLLYYLIQEFYASAFERPIENLAEMLSVMRHYPRLDEVSRARRKVIQDNGYRKYLPTIRQVSEQRKINEVYWHDYMAREGQEINDKIMQVKESDIHDSKHIPPDYNPNANIPVEYWGAFKNDTL